MIKLIDILTENKILVPRRNAPGERDKNKERIAQVKIQQYIKGGNKGDLDFGGDLIKSIPDNLKEVGGYLNLEKTKITSLPDNLTIHGDLYIEYTSITSLPKGLKIRGSLYANGTYFTSLPDDIYIGGNISLYDTHIESLPDSLTKINGYLNMNGSLLEYLPEDIEILGYLNILNTPLANHFHGLMIFDRRELEIKYPGVRNQIYF